jgi:LysM repeat protein
MSFQKQQIFYSSLSQLRMKITLALVLASTAYVAATPAPQTGYSNGEADCQNAELLTVDATCQTLQDIAAEHGLNYADLADSNPHILDGSKTYEGDVICACNEDGGEPAATTQGEVDVDSTQVVAGSTETGETYGETDAATSTQDVEGSAETGTDGEGNYGGEGNSPRVATSPCTGTEFEVLLEDDTLTHIADINGVELASVQAANTHLDSSNPDGPLYIGEIVCFPTSCYPKREVLANNEAQCEEFFTVVDGDTLESIAAANNLDLATLIAANTQIGNPDLIFPGDKVCKPAGCPGYGYTDNKEADEAYGDGANGGGTEATETEASTVETATESTTEATATDEADGDLETEDQGDEQGLQSSAHSLVISVFLGVATLFVAFL